MTAELTGKFNEAADPKVQLEQAIIEAQDQHRRLKEQAANVIANQKQTEMRLNRAMEELEKVNANARQAVLMADEATKKRRRRQGGRVHAGGRVLRQPADRPRAARSRTSRRSHLQSTQAAEQAKAAVPQNATALQKKLSERQKLLGQLDQAKMQEQMNKAMASLERDRRRGRPHLRRGPGQDRGPLRQGQGHGRAHRADRSRAACSRSSRPP